MSFIHPIPVDAPVVLVSVVMGQQGGGAAILDQDQWDGTSWTALTDCAASGDAGGGVVNQASYTGTAYYVANNTSEHRSFDQYGTWSAETGTPAATDDSTGGSLQEPTSAGMHWYPYNRFGTVSHYAFSTGVWTGKAAPGGGAYYNRGVGAHKYGGIWDEDSHRVYDATLDTWGSETNIPSNMTDMAAAGSLSADTGPHAHFLFSRRDGIEGDGDNVCWKWNGAWVGVGNIIAFPHGATAGNDGNIYLLTGRYQSDTFQKYYTSADTYVAQTPLPAPTRYNERMASFS